MVLPGQIVHSLLPRAEIGPNDREDAPRFRFSEITSSKGVDISGVLFTVSMSILKLNVKGTPEM